MNKHIKIIAMQAVFLIFVIVLLYILYPKTNIDVNGDFVKFSSINAKVIMISNNPDFSNPRYIEIAPGENVTFDFTPGTYYYKPDNGIIQGLKKEFTIESQVGMRVEKKENDSNLVNIGNVKINVTKSKNGMMVGRIILEPEGREKIEDKDEMYKGGQE
jgi:hypothetical protein